jgi:hypothetical protein
MNEAKFIFVSFVILVVIMNSVYCLPWQCNLVEVYRSFIGTYVRTYIFGVEDEDGWAPVTHRACCLLTWPSRPPKMEAVRSPKYP